MTKKDDELFAFEVPTPEGNVRIVAPVNLTRDQGRQVGLRIATIFEAMFTYYPEPRAERQFGDMDRIYHAVNTEETKP